jgi:hypothetical protein
MGGTASTKGSSSLQSWILSADSATASGILCRSTIERRLVDFRGRDRTGDRQQAIRLGAGVVDAQVHRSCVSNIRWPRPGIGHGDGARRALRQSVYVAGDLVGRRAVGVHQLNPAIRVNEVRSGGMVERVLAIAEILPLRDDAEGGLWAVMSASEPISPTTPGKFAMYVRMRSAVSRAGSRVAKYMSTRSASGPNVRRMWLNCARLSGQTSAQCV